VSVSAAAPARLPNSGLMQMAGSILAFGAVWPITKIALNDGASPMWFAVGRAGFAGLAAFVVLGVMGRLRRPSRRDLPALLSISLLQIGGFFALANAAVAWVEAGRTAVLANVTTMWIVPLSILVLHEHIPPRRWVAAALGLAGTAVLMGPWSIDWTSSRVLIGHAFLLGASLAFAVSIVIVLRFPPEHSMLELLPWTFLLAALELVAPALLTGGFGRWPLPAVAALLYVGVLVGPIGTWCLMQAQATLPSMVTSVGFLGTPACNLLVATWWLGEPFGPDLLTGTGLILAGVLAAAWPERRR
jgi:O-acetylserine/cysteine efflux transporter